MTSVIKDVATRFPTIHDWVRPYVGRQNAEGLEMGGSVVIYEADLGFLSDLLTGEQASSIDELRVSLPGEALEQVKQKLQGLVSVLDANPLAVLVVAHVGTPAP